jgi:hypothetical protein
VKSLLLLPLLLGACELRGLTGAQLYGSSPDAALVARDASAPPADLPVSVIDAPQDGPPPLPLVLVTGSVQGLCGPNGAMIGGGGAHTCSYAGKNSYTLRLRNVVPGTRIELVARRPGYLPDPNTFTITVEETGVQHDFIFTPSTGSCDPAPPDPGPCVCNPDAGCEPS